MSLWYQSLGLCLYDYEEDDVEGRAECILSHLSMEIPRSWWEQALQTGKVAEVYIRILRGLLEELKKLPGSTARVDYTLLVALAFSNDDEKSKLSNLNSIANRYSVEEYLARAEAVLIRRPELRQVGKMIEQSLKENIQSNVTA